MIKGTQPNNGGLSHGDLINVLRWDLNFDCQLIVVRNDLQNYFRRRYYTTNCVRRKLMHNAGLRRHYINSSEFVSRSDRTFLELTDLALNFPKFLSDLCS